MDLKKLVFGLLFCNCVSLFGMEYSRQLLENFYLSKFELVRRYCWLDNNGHCRDDRPCYSFYKIDPVVFEAKIKMINTKNLRQKYSGLTCYVARIVRASTQEVKGEMVFTIGIVLSQHSQECTSLVGKKIAVIRSMTLNDCANDPMLGLYASLELDFESFARDQGCVQVEAFAPSIFFNYTCGYSKRSEVAAWAEGEFIKVLQ